LPHNKGHISRHPNWAQRIVRINRANSANGAKGDLPIAVDNQAGHEVGVKITSNGIGNGLMQKEFLMLWTASRRHEAWNQTDIRNASASAV
jgi:hypothetical protein